MSKTIIGEDGLPRRLTDLYCGKCNSALLWDSDLQAVVDEGGDEMYDCPACYVSFGDVEPRNNRRPTTKTRYS